MTVKQNPDKVLVQEIRRQLKENGGYCPCSLVKNEDTRCMCKKFRELIEKREPGMCHCGLYIVSADDES